MTTPLLLYAVPGSGHLHEPVLKATGAQNGVLEMTRFPDGESYLRFDTSPKGKHIAFLACLNDPDAKLFSLLLAARTARDIGASSIGLIAPYMPYFRQDIAFNPGESISAHHIGAILSDVFSWVVTLDPHLHRISRMQDVFSIPSEAATSTAPIASWIKQGIERPIICGPDAESEQWVSKIAAACASPHLVFQKTRYDSKTVDVAVDPDIDLSGYTPVIVDDIISTGGTVVSLAEALVQHRARSAVCCVVHALFSNDIEKRLLNLGIEGVVSTNSIFHATNAIDVSGVIANSTKRTFDRFLKSGNPVSNGLD